MKFRHQVRFTRSCYLTVNYDVYWMFRAHFSHFMINFITEITRFCLSKLDLKRCMVLISHKWSIVVVKILNIFNNTPKFQRAREKGSTHQFCFISRFTPPSSSPKFIVKIDMIKPQDFHRSLLQEKKVFWWITKFLKLIFKETIINL